MPRDKYDDLIDSVQKPDKYDALIDSVSDSPLEQAAAGAARSIGPDVAREILPAAAGMFAGGTLGGPLGILGAGVVAAGTRGYQNIAESALGGEPLGTWDRQALLLGKTALANSGGEGLARGIGVVAKAVRPAAEKLGGQIIRVFTGVPEKDAAAVLRDPSILSRAKTVAEAGKEFGDATGGLESGAKGARKALGKSHWSGEAIADKFDELAPQIADESIDTQTLLALRQRTMKAIADLPYNQKELRYLLSENLDAMEPLLEKRLPKWRGSNTGYRESKIAEEFSSPLPLNKNLSPNVLRTSAAVAGAVKGAIDRTAWGLVGLPLISPKVWGYGIRAAAAAAKPIVGLGNIGMRAGLSYELPPGTYPIK